MGYTVNSIVINKNINDLFLLINNIENWNELHGYESVELLDKQTLIDKKVKITFKVTSFEDGQEETWTSQRIIDFSTYSARGVRLEPMFPFKHWILDVTLSEEEQGTRMTWTQDFRMDNNSGYSENQVEELINKGSKKELKVFKDKIESGTVYKKLQK